MKALQCFNCGASSFMEVFRERIVRIPETEEPISVPVQTPNETEGKPDPNVRGLKDSGDIITNVEVWEGENNKKYINQYFNTHNISHEFTVKMPTSEIDKYIKGELESRGYEKTTDNYENILREIESEIGSGKLELFKRLQKIVGYIRAINKLNKAKELKARYVVPATGLDG